MASRFVYGRNHCGRCDAELEHLEIAGRAINACPVCQPRDAGGTHHSIAEGASSVGRSSIPGPFSIG